MTWRRKPGSPPGRPAVADPRRPFTDLTWTLVAIMLDEERHTWREIAGELHRDPEDLAAKLREDIKRGVLDAERRRLLGLGMLYAMRMAKRRRECS